MNRLSLLPAIQAAAEDKRRPPRKDQRLSQAKPCSRCSVEPRWSTHRACLYCQACIKLLARDRSAKAAAKAARTRNAEASHLAAARSVSAKITSRISAEVLRERQTTLREQAAEQRRRRLRMAEDGDFAERIYQRAA